MKHITTIIVCAVVVIIIIIIIISLSILLVLIRYHGNYCLFLKAKSFVVCLLLLFPHSVSFSN